jgi:hypothetical protein
LLTVVLNQLGAYYPMLLPLKFPTEEEKFGQHHPNHQLDTCMSCMETMLYENQKYKLPVQKIVQYLVIQILTQTSRNIKICIKWLVLSQIKEDFYFYFFLPCFLLGDHKHMHIDWDRPNAPQKMDQSMSNHYQHRKD